MTQHRSQRRIAKTLTRSRLRHVVSVTLWAILTWPLLVSNAPAQSASFRSVDTNSDRVLSRSELTAAFGAAGASRLLRRSDRNGDGVLTVGELRRDPDDDRGDRPADRGERNDRNDDDRDDDGGDDGDGDGDGGGDDGGGDGDED